MLGVSKDNQRALVISILGGLLGSGIFAGVLALVGATHRALDVVLLALLVASLAFLVILWARLHATLQEVSTVGATALSREQKQLTDWTGLEDYRKTLNGSQYHPSEALKGVHRGLDFLGHGASKWTRDRESFTKMLIRVDDAGKHYRVRMLVLDPASDVCLETSARLFSTDRLKWPKKILTSLQVLRALQADHKNLEIRVYDHEPIFRVTIIDGTAVTVGHYRNYDQDSDFSPILVFGANDGWSFCSAFQQLFNAEWDNSKAVDWDAVRRQAGELGVESKD